MNGPHPPAPPESFDGFDLLGHHGPSFNAKAIAVCPPAITRQRLERVPVVHRSRQVRPA